MRFTFVTISLKDKTYALWNVYLHHAVVCLRMKHVALHHIVPPATQWGVFTTIQTVQILSLRQLFSHIMGLT